MEINSINKDETLKLKIIIYSYDSIIVKEDPLINILETYNEIKNLSNLNLYEAIKYFYFSINKVENILYETDELIDIEKEEKNLAFHFYLNLLIKVNLTITNYSYSFYLIEELNKVRKNIKQEFKSILYAKCIIDLINYYTQLDKNDDDKKKKQLEKIQIENEKYIKDKIKIFNEINLNKDENYLKENKIDEIYSDIIEVLILNDKFENFDYVYKLIHQLELEKINITQTIYLKLFKIMNDGKFVKKYLIKKKEDLFEEEKINFYYILLRYILKNSIYIYQIPLLLATRKNILIIIKNDGLLYDELSNNNKDKLKYILETLSDSKYYFENKNISKIKLKEILKYYKGFYFETKKEDINIIENIIKNNKKDYKNYLSEYDIAKKMNIRMTIIKYIIGAQEPDDLKNESQIKKYLEYWNTLEEIILNKKIGKMRKDGKKILMNFFNKDKNNKNLLLKIFDKEQLDYFINKINNNPDKKEIKKSSINEINISNKKESISKSKLALLIYLPQKNSKSTNPIIIYENINDPMILLFSNFNQIENLLILADPNIIKFLFFNRTNIHKILFNEEKIIEINIQLDKEIENLNIFFYLNLLINDNINIVNYSYSLDFIRKINNKKENKNEYYKLIIKAKIIIELINNYKQLDIYNEEREKEELNNIRNKNEFLIKKYEEKLRDLGLNGKFILEKKIDEIYIEIIIALIKSEKIKMYEYSESLLKQIDLENIIITKKMIDNLDNFLNKNPGLMNNYKIYTFLDFFDKDRKNFYFILLKFVLKNPIYIYQVKYFFDTRKSIIIIIEKELKNLSTSFNIKSFDKNMDKIKDIIISITGSEYYYKLFLDYIEPITRSKTCEFFDSINNKDNDNLKSVPEEEIDYSNILDEDLEDDFSNILSIVDGILDKSCFYLDASLNGDITYNKIIFENRGISYDKLTNMLKKLLKTEEKQEFRNEHEKRLFSNYKKFIEFLECIKVKIKKKLVDKNLLNFRIIIKLLICTIKELVKYDFKNISCEFVVVSPNYIDIMDIKCIENNILIRDNYKEFDSLISKIIEAKVEEINNQTTGNGMQSSLISSINHNTKNTYTSNSQSNIRQIVNQMDESKIIIRFKKIIGVHNKSANYVLELDNGYLVSGGPSNLFIYENDNIKKRFEIEHNSIFPITNEKKSIDIIINTNKEIKIVTINKNGNIEEFLKPINCEIKSKFCFVLNKKYLIVNDEGFFQYNDILGKIIQIKGNIITNDIIFSGGIKINDYVLALTSNKYLTKGQDKIIFYNNMSKKIFKEIEGYSFAKSQNNLALIKGQILLCACTKYGENQKNGILLIKTNDDEVELMSNPFYDTGEFEVHCFCPLSSVNNSNNNQIFNNEKVIKQTNYCFIGGYDKMKNEGLIKIYKINYNNDIVKTQIEFVEDIILNNFVIDKKNEKNKFQGFKTPINCIIQSIKTQNIIITDLGGNVYLFDKLNINNL